MPVMFYSLHYAVYNMDKHSHASINMSRLSLNYNYNTKKKNYDFLNFFFFALHHYLQVYKTHTTLILSMNKK